MRFNDTRDKFLDDGNANPKLNRKFENFTYHKFKNFTGGAYAPYAPCMGTPLIYTHFPAAYLRQMHGQEQYTQVSIESDPRMTRN